MLVKRIILPLLALLISGFATSQNVNIQGVATNQSGKIIRVQVYADQFSRLMKTLGETTTDNNGSFLIKADVQQTDFAFLALDLDKNQFYLSPGYDYHFDIPEDTSTNNGSIFDKTSFLFNLKTDNPIQDVIEEFNFEYNTFIYNNVNYIYKSKDKTVVTTFADDILEKYNEAPAYAKNYITYSVASLYWLSGKFNNKEITEKYFVSKPILYNNIQYTEFFTDFFKSYFSSEGTFRYEDMIFAINRTDNISGMDDLVCRDSLLATNKQLREIIEMEILARNYFNRDIVQDKVDEKYKEIQKESDFAENRIIAGNYLIKLNQMKSGTIAPEITLTDGNKDINIQDFRDKFILLNFISDNSNICNFQMLQLMDLRKLMNNSFDIITVVNGTDYNNVKEFAKTNNIEWPVLQLKNILDLESYQVATFPTYILINPDGTIANAHLPNPQENMGLYIQKLMDKYNTTK